MQQVLRLRPCFKNQVAGCVENTRHHDLSIRRRGHDKCGASFCGACGHVFFFSFCSFFFQFDQISIQTIEAFFPETAVFLHKVGNVLERTSFQAARPPLGFAPARDQSSALQNFQMLGNRRHAHLKRLGQLGNRCLTRRQASQYGAPRGIGQGREGGAE